jgi:hypothetical protein
VIGRRFAQAAAALVLTAAASPLVAEESPGRTVSAAEPGDLVLALLNAGYDPELTKDEYGDPLIRFQRPDGYRMQMFFYECDEETRENCGSIQLRAAFDRAEPWTHAEAMEILDSLRLISVRLDDDGDPLFAWDILTRRGIPESLFIEAVESFELTIEEAAQMTFAEEREAEEAEGTAEAEAAAAPSGD